MKMPPHKPPKRLSEVALTNVGHYLLSYCMSVSYESFYSPDFTCLEPHSRERKCQQFIDESIHWLREHLFSSVPWYCHQSLLDISLRVLSEAAQQAKSTFKRTLGSPHNDWSAHCVKTIVRFVRTCIHPSIKKLDLSCVGPKAIRDEIYKGLDHFTGLEVITLCPGHSSSSNQESSSNILLLGKRVFMSFKYFHNLRSMTLNNDCQNETLAVVGQNCHLLSHLDIAGSQGVTDTGATWLLSCAKLANLDLYQTSVSVEAYAQLLVSLPKLKSVGRCDAMGQVLEYLATYNRDPVKLSIKTFHSRDVSYDQLRLLTSMCPQLTHVSLYVDEDAGNLLEPLNTLENLTEVKLLACNFYADKVDQLLVNKGRQLTLLHLEHIDELDMNALCCVAESCVNLERLVFFSCDFVENFGQSLSEKVFAVQPFRYLQSLVCVSESAPNIIEFLLVHACHLKSVQFGSTAWFNDDTVSKVLAKGALKEIEEIRILRSYELTMRAVNLLLDSCPKLNILAEMDGWEGISQLELTQLRKRIREENLDLDTFIAWSVTG